MEVKTNLHYQNIKTMRNQSFDTLKYFGLGIVVYFCSKLSAIFDRR